MDGDTKLPVSDATIYVNVQQPERKEYLVKTDQNGFFILFDKSAKEMLTYYISLRVSQTTYKDHIRELSLNLANDYKLNLWEKEKE